jgi:hypothetical protein
MKFKAVSMKFAGIHPPRQSDNVSAVPDNYYEGVNVPVHDKGKVKTLFISKTKKDKCKLMLSEGGISQTKARELEPVSLQKMKEAVKNGVFHISGMILRFKPSKALRKLVV